MLIIIFDNSGPDRNIDIFLKDIYLDFLLFIYIFFYICLVILNNVGQFAVLYHLLPSRYCQYFDSFFNKFTNQQNISV